MPTRVHLAGGVVSPVTPSSWSAGWNKTTGASTAAFTPSGDRDANNYGELSNTLSGTSGHYTAVYRAVSFPLESAQTIDGSIKGQFICRQSAAGDNTTLAFAVKVITSAGADRGICLAVTASDDTSTTPPELATTMTNRRLLDASENASITLSSVAASVGDCVVIEIGVRQASTSTSLFYIESGSSNSSSDAGENDTDTGGTTFNSWVEFSADLVFPDVIYYDSRSNPTDNTTNTADPTAVTPPSGMLAGDLVFLIADSRIASLTQAISDAGGQTWTSHAQQSATTKSVRVFTCTFNGTWSADPSVSFGSTTCNSAYMHVFRPPATNYTWAVNVAQTSTNDTTSPFSALTGHTTVGNRAKVTLQGWHSPDDNTWGTLTGTGWGVTGTAQYRNTSGSDQSASFAHAITTTAATLATPSKLQATLGPDNAQMWAITMEAVPPARTLIYNPLSHMLAHLAR